MPDPAPPQWEALDRREAAHLLLGMVPPTSFEDAMRQVAELERRGIFVVRAVPSTNGASMEVWPSEELVEAAIKAMVDHANDTPDRLGYSVVVDTSRKTHG